MKKIDKTKDVKSTDFANTIYCIRRERKLTQKGLADLIGVSDRTISKWENGTTVPDLETIKRLCKELGISPSSIVKSKKSLKDYSYVLKKNAGHIFNYMLKNIFLIGFIVIFILLLIFFINNYNTIKIYSITHTRDDITFKDGYFFNTKVLNIITINDIKLDKIKYEPTSIKIELYTYLNGDKHLIYESDNLSNIFIKERKSYADLLSKDVISSIKNNLYIKIYTVDENNKKYTYEDKLVLKQKLSNNKLCYIDYYTEQNNELKDLNSKNPFLVSLSKSYNNFNSPNIVNDTSSNNKLNSLGYIYDEENKTYTKIDNDGGVIEYCSEVNELKKDKVEGNIRYSTRYVVKEDVVMYKIVQDNCRLMLNYKYFIYNNTFKCFIGNCKNYKSEIDYILSIYKEIEATL